MNKMLDIYVTPTYNADGSGELLKCDSSRFYLARLKEVERAASSSSFEDNLSSASNVLILLRGIPL